MQTIGFQEAVERITAEDARFHPDAYAFLRDALEFTVKRRKKSRKEAADHVSAGELLEGFRLHALNEYGPMAITVLDYWGVRCCENVGEMVFHLVKSSVFGKTEEDTIDRFREGYGFREAFSEPFLPARENLSAAPAPVVRENT